tara:strand:+ start:263 stop:517 length:255 start_codon:yes stop_codon:yes gene_type:complete
MCLKGDHGFFDYRYPTGGTLISNGNRCQMRKLLAPLPQHSSRSEIAKKIAKKCHGARLFRDTLRSENDTLGVRTKLAFFSICHA